MFGTPFFCMQYVCGVLRSGAFDGMLQNAKGAHRVKSKKTVFFSFAPSFFLNGNFADTPARRRSVNFNTLTDM